MKTFNITIDNEEEARFKEAKEETHLTWKGILLNWLENYEIEKARRR